ncbi:hypothetical protein QN277_022449 [Acacia crassicarpa]|uniref:Reverse transcriptase domain-containing protein n=1 Tax=Acacia crassicarpa TaxID=499986 RepID=A0AAE1JF69_9FABA|nr:hypothetical protein QN277_022449 [Acacia crassicarpa]
MVVKIDLEKAYDRMSWSFLEKVLEDIGFNEQFRRVVKGCIRSANTAILWNGSKQEVFAPSKGLRQGDPLSPYLFVLGMEKLSHMITDEVNNGRWKALRMGRHGVEISHLLFADDLLLICEADRANMSTVMEVLHRFGEVSGQRVNA